MHSTGSNILGKFNLVLHCYCPKKMNLVLFMVAQIQPGQDILGQGHRSSSKATSRSPHDNAQRAGAVG